MARTGRKTRISNIRFIWVVFYVFSSAALTEISDLIPETECLRQQNTELRLKLNSMSAAETLAFVCLLPGTYLKVNDISPAYQCFIIDVNSNLNLTLGL